MKQIFLYVLLFVAVIGLIFGIFYLIITLKTPTEGIIIEDILGDVMDEEVIEEKLDYRFEGNGEDGEEVVESVVYEGEGFSFEYPSDFDLNQVEITSEADETIQETAEEVQIGTWDFYQMTEGEMVSFYTFENNSSLQFTVPQDLDETFKEILETINFEKI